MSGANQPNIITGLLSIHAVITRGLEVAIESSERFAQQGFPDAVSREGLLNYLHCLISVLGGHHDTEDTVAFPAFRTKIDAPFDLLAEQHRQLHQLLEEAKLELERMNGGPSPNLVLLLRRIQELWHPHIAIEEEHFTLDRFAALLPADEHQQMSQLCMRHMQQHTGPDYLIVPFLLYNLTPEKRSVFANDMPPIVTTELVPVVWKEKWAPMRPFLLA